MKKKSNILSTIWLLFLVAIVVTTGYLLYLKINTVNFGNYSNLLGMNSDGSLITDYSNLKDSGITGEDYSFDETYNPYYGLLSSDAKELYKQIYANFDSLERTFVPIIETDKDSVDIVIEAVLYDNPEIFWMGDSYTYKYTKDGICRQITLNFNDLVKNYDTNKSKMENAANIIIRGANKYSTNYEKELYVHNELIKRIDYDANSKYNQTAYSALVNNSTVCAGYAKAFQYIMNKLKIPTYYVTGVSSGEDHAWNMVYLDGFYNIDLTWDDAASYHYQFFNLTDLKFNNTHQRGSLSSGLPKCTSINYNYENQNQKIPTKVNKTPPKEEVIPKVKEPEKKTKEEIPEVDIEETDQTNTPETPSSDDKTVPSNQENNKEDNTSEVVEEDNTEKPTYYKRERDSSIN